MICCRCFYTIHEWWRMYIHSLVLRLYIALHGTALVVTLVLSLCVVVVRSFSSTVNDSVFAAAKTIHWLKNFRTLVISQRGWCWWSEGVVVMHPRALSTQNRRCVDASAWSIRSSAWAYPPLFRCLMQRINLQACQATTEWTCVTTVNLLVSRFRNEMSMARTLMESRHFAKPRSRFIQQNPEASSGVGERTVPLDLHSDPCTKPMFVNTNSQLS